MRLSLSLGLLLGFLLACGGGEPEAASDLGDTKALCKARMPDCAGEECTDAEFDKSFAAATPGMPWGQALAKKYQEGTEIPSDADYALADKIFETKALEKSLDCILVIAGLKMSEPELFEEGGRFYGKDKTPGEAGAATGGAAAGGTPADGAAAPTEAAAPADGAPADGAAPAAAQ